MLTWKVLGGHPADRIAVISQTGAAIRYGDLEQAVTALSARLSERRLVFIVGGNDLPTLRCYLAALAGGAVALLLGRQLASAQLASLIRLYDPTWVFLPDTFSWERAGSTVEWAEDGATLYRRPTAASHVLHDDLGLLLATSGSTGSPRLVRLTCENLRANAASIVEYLGIGPDERAITSLPFNYSYGLSVINSHLLAGASLVLSDASLMDSRFWGALNEHRATSFAGVPYSYEMLLKLRLSRLQLPTVRTLTQAGGRLDAARMKEVNAMCRERGIRFFPMYGQTEATARIAYLSPDDVDRKQGSLGRAIPGGRLWLEDPGGGVITTPGEVGELTYAGANVSMGYADRPEDLALGDVNHGTLRTGDLARFDAEGFFFIEGRRSRFLKVFGNRIALDAVEASVAAQGWSCAALGRDDLLVVFVAARAGGSAEALRVELATTLGVHPSAVRVEVLPELPRLATGKVDSQGLSRLV